MQRFLLIGIFILLNTPPSTFAANTLSLEEKSNSTADKKDNDDRRTFTAKISSIRSVQGEYDVFFVDHPTPYEVPFSLPDWKKKDQTPEDFLRAALKQQAEVTVTVDTNTDTLVSIDSELKRSPAAAQQPSLDLPPEMDYLKDIIKKTVNTKN